MKTRRYEAEELIDIPGDFAINEYEYVDGERVVEIFRRVAELHDVTKEEAEKTAASLQAQYDRLTGV